MSWWVGGAGGREPWTVLSGTSAMGHGLHVADRAQGLGHIYTSIYYCCKSCPVLLHDDMVGGWIASYVFIFIFWSRCCCCCCLLLLLLKTSVLKRREMLARSDSPQSRGPCLRAGPPSPRPSRSASEVARSGLRGLPHAPQSQRPRAVILRFIRRLASFRPKACAQR